MADTDKLTISIGVDTSAVKEATDALNGLAEATDRAKTAIDALFGEDTVTVHVGIDHGEDVTREVVESIRRGARRTDHRFKL